jgi:hypothetical protein
MIFLFKFFEELECIFFHIFSHKHVLVTHDHLGVFSIYRCRKCGREWED